MHERHDKFKNRGSLTQQTDPADLPGLIRRRLRGGGFARGCGCGDRPADAALSVLLRLASPTMDRAADEGDVRVCLNLAISSLGNCFLFL